MPTFSPDTLRAAAELILVAAGTPADLAQVVSESLVEANLVGHDSHGVIRLPAYVDLVRLGKVQPAARPRLVATHQATARVDAARGWGQPAARLATQTAIDLAGLYGVGAVTIDHCNHIGRLGEYVESMSQAGLIGMALCNAEPVVAPFGGREGRMGTNPIAWAVPLGAGQPPLLVDFATAGVAEGKLRVARAKGETVPPGLILDRNGRPSTEPADFYDGGVLLPFGGHKGYGINVLIELLGGALSGMAPSALPEYQGGNGTLLLGLNIASFVPLAQFTGQATALSEKIKATPTAEGFHEILVPGEPERRSRRQRLEQGIYLPEQTWLALQSLAGELHVTL